MVIKRVIQTPALFLVIKSHIHGLNTSILDFKVNYKYLAWRQMQSREGDTSSYLVCFNWQLEGHYETNGKFLLSKLLPRVQT